MVWDKTLPDGSVDIAVGDDKIRLNNAAIELALNLEHKFVTGGVQDGRHVLQAFTLANANLETKDTDDNYWIVLITDQRDNLCWFLVKNP